MAPNYFSGSYLGIPVSWPHSTTADVYGPIEVNPYIGGDGNQHFVCRTKNSKTQYLHKDGSWNAMCNQPGFFPSRREAEVAAVLAGMPDKRVAEMEAANERATKRLADKQRVLDQISKESAANSEANRELRAENDRLKQRNNCGEEWKVLYDCFPGGTGHDTYTEAAAAEIVKLRAEVVKLVAKENEPRCDYGSMYTSLCKRYDRLATELADAKSRKVSVDVGDKTYQLGRGDSLTHEIKVKVTA